MENSVVVSIAGETRISKLKDTLVEIIQVQERKGKRMKEKTWQTPSSLLTSTSRESRKKRGPRGEERKITQSYNGQKLLKFD